MLENPSYRPTVEVDKEMLLQAKGALLRFEEIVSTINVGADGYTKPGEYIYELFGAANITVSTCRTLLDVFSEAIKMLAEGMS